MPLKIPLTQGLIAIVDNDMHYLLQYEWQAMKGWNERTYYAKRDYGNNCILMHRVILGIEFTKDTSSRVDHIDGNGLNNQRSNLRILSASLNTFKMENLRSDNKSGTTGVYWSKQKQKWLVEAKIEGVRYYLGSYNSKEQAIAARKQKENEVWQLLAQ